MGNVTRSNLKRKGHERFVKTAHSLPDVKSILVGKWLDDAIDYSQPFASPNVEFTGWMEDKTLNDLAARSSVYVQLSQQDGFRLSVEEAMLAGCIPGVTQAGSLPKVVCEVGAFVGVNDPVEIARTVAGLVESEDTSRGTVHQRNLANFPIAKRRQALHELIGGVIGN